jgi:hypothetical protein
MQDPDAFERTMYAGLVDKFGRKQKRLLRLKTGNCFMARFRTSARKEVCAHLGDSRKRSTEKNARSQRSEAMKRIQLPCHGLLHVLHRTELRQDALPSRASDAPCIRATVSAEVQAHSRRETVARMFHPSDSLGATVQRFLSCFSSQVRLNLGH